MLLLREEISKSNEKNTLRNDFIIIPHVDTNLQQKRQPYLLYPNSLLFTAIGNNYL